MSQVDTISAMVAVTQNSVSITHHLDTMGYFNPFFYSRAQTPNICHLWLFDYGLFELDYGQ